MSVVGIFRGNCRTRCWSDVSTGENSITSLNSHALNLKEFAFGAEEISKWTGRSIDHVR